MRYRIAVLLTAWWYDCSCGSGCTATASAYAISGLTRWHVSDVPSNVQSQLFHLLDHDIDVNGLQEMRDDICALHAAGWGTAAGVSSQTTGIREGVHQIWLETAAGGDRGSSSPQSLQTCLLGRVETRRSLLQWAHHLRIKLSEQLGQPLSDLELSYLLYREGAYYNKHVDTIASSGARSKNRRRRVISFLLYLGDPYDFTSPWDADRDGGALRLYNHNADSYVDVSPIPGRLILFDSATTHHEVCRTVRPRAAVAGWFGTIEESVASAGARGS